MHSVTQEIMTSLVNEQNPVQAKEMAAYMKEHFPFLGIAMPKRRKLIAPILKNSHLLSVSDLQLIIKQLYDLPEREFHYAAIDLLEYNIKRFSADFAAIEYYLSFIELKAWWDSVDRLRKVFSLWVQQNQGYLNNMMEVLVDVESFWSRRTAITFQLQWKQQTNLHWLEKSILDNQTDNEFFIQKAIGWALREYSKTDKIWVTNFLGRPDIQLSNLAVREASKYL